MKLNDYKVILLDFLLLLSSTLILLCPLLNIISIKQVLAFSIVFFGFISALKFIVAKHYRDFENIYNTVASLAFAGALYFINLTNKKLAIFMLIWLFVLCIIKLVKCDYYHDNKNILWVSKISGIFVYLLTGTISVLNFSHGNIITIVVLGYFFMINYIIEIMNDVYQSIR